MKKKEKNIQTKMKRTNTITIYIAIFLSLLIGLESCNNPRTEQNNSEGTELILETEAGDISEESDSLPAENEIVFNIHNLDFSSSEAYRDYPDSKEIRTKQINKSDFNEHLAKEPEPFMVYDTLKYLKTNRQIKLPIDNGTVMVFKDYPSDNDGFTFYHYRGYLSNINKYVLSVELWEAYTCLLIEKSDGTVTIHARDVLFNKEGTRMLIIDPDPYENTTVFYVYNTNLKTAEMSYMLATEGCFHILGIYWGNEHTFDIKYEAHDTSGNQDTDNYPIKYMRLYVE